MTLVPPVSSAPAKPNTGLFKRNAPIAGEAEAIEAAKNGDAQAFSKLYTLHKRRVYTLCLRMLGNVSEAEDMTQEAFLHLFRKLGSFRGESAFSTWLHRLTVNLVLMHLRKKGLNLVSLEETINPSEDDAPKRDFGSRDPQLAGSVDRVALERAVASLPPGYRMVFVLHDVEGFEHNEIATMLECSTGNSKSQLHKARLKLRELLRSTSQPVPIPALAHVLRENPAMNGQNDPIDFDNMSQADFEANLPDFFGNGSVSTDPRLQKFLATHPDCAALVSDLETIAEHARSLFGTATHEPSDDVWARIQTSLKDDPIAPETGIPAGVRAGTQTESGALSLNGEPSQLITGGSLHDIE